MDKLFYCKDIRKEVLIIKRLKETLLSAKIIFMQNKNKYNVSKNRYGIMLSLFEKGLMVHKPLLYEQKEDAEKDLERILSLFKEE